MFQFILAVLFVELTPGQNMAYLASLSLARGRTAGLFAIVGVALGLGVHAAVASFGIGELLLLYPRLYEILRWIGVTYLLFLAWEGWQTDEKPLGTADLNSAPGPLILRGFLSTVFNPKSVLYLCFCRSNIRADFAGSTKFFVPDGDLRYCLRRHSHSSACVHCDVGRRVKAMARRGAAPKCGPAWIGSRSRVRGRLAILGDKTLS
jgi:hypothetical protein